MTKKQLIEKYSKELSYYKKILKISSCEFIKERCSLIIQFHRQILSDLRKLN